MKPPSEPPQKVPVAEVNRTVPTTYVFGAGASLHAGYPLASAMGEGLLDFMLGYPMPPYPSEAQFVIDTFGKAPNIEDVITLLQSRIDSLQGRGNSRRQGRAHEIRQLPGIPHRLAAGMVPHGLIQRPAPAYGDFSTKVVKPGDVVITFNYDDSLERELRRAGKWDIACGYGFPLGTEEQPSNVLVLKLHGSMNWLISIFGGATHGTFQVANWPLAALGRHPVIHRADLQYLGYADFAGHTYQSGGAFPCLILPGRRKRIFLRHILRI